MKSWQAIRSAIVTPGGHASSLDAPEALSPSFASFTASSAVPCAFDRTVDETRAAGRACESVHAAVTAVLRDEQRPLLLGGECSLVAGSLAAAASCLPELRLLFFDAHGDFNTPATSPSGYFGGMCLAHACGDWADAMPRLGAPFAGERVCLVGGRELDPGEGANLERRGVTRRAVEDTAGIERTVRAAGGHPWWIHIDLDIVRPEEMFAVSHPVAGGIGFAALERLLAVIARAAPVAGLALCGYLPAKDPERVLPARIAAAVAPLFSS